MKTLQLVKISIAAVAAFISAGSAMIDGEFAGMTPMQLKLAATKLKARPCAQPHHAALTGEWDDFAKGKQAGNKAGYEDAMDKIKARTITRIDAYIDALVPGGNTQLLHDDNTVKIVGKPGALAGGNAMADFNRDTFKAKLADIIDAVTAAGLGASTIPADDTLFELTRYYGELTTGIAVAIGAYIDLLVPGGDTQILHDDNTVKITGKPAALVNAPNLPYATADFNRDTFKAVLAGLVR